MIIIKGLRYDRKQNLIIPDLPKDLGPWKPPLPGRSIEVFDDTPDCIHRWVFYNRETTETKENLLGNWYYHEAKRRIRDHEGVLIRERVVYLKNARVYAVELVYAMPDPYSIEHKLHKERMAYGGLTRAEFLARQEAHRIRQKDYHSLRWNPQKHREKVARRRARATA